MEERNWNNEFLGRCGYPRLVWADGVRIELSDERHAAYWDEHAKIVMLGPDAEVHAMEMALLPEADELVDLPDPGERVDIAHDVNAVVQEVEDVQHLDDISDLPQAQAIELVVQSEDVEELRGWLMSTRNNQVKGAIKKRLAELG